jgi:hypothetical protein
MPWKFLGLATLGPSRTHWCWAGRFLLGCLPGSSQPGREFPGFSQRVRQGPSPGGSVLECITVSSSHICPSGKKVRLEVNRHSRERERESSKDCHGSASKLSWFRPIPHLSVYCSVLFSLCKTPSCILLGEPASCKIEAVEALELANRPRTTFQSTLDWF